MQPFTPGWPDLFIAAKRGKRYQIVTKLPNCHKIYQMPIENTNFFIPRPSKITANLDFWFENIPSGNPESD
jgi:hypothetical protein